MQLINEVVKQYWPKDQPQGKPLEAGLQLDFMLLITTVWAWQFRQPTSLPTYLNLYFVSLSMRVLWETVLKALLKSR